MIMFVNWALHNLINDISSWQYYEFKNNWFYTIINNKFYNYLILY